MIGHLEGSFNPYADPVAGLQAILSLRSVSKSWKAATSQYAGKLSVKVQRPSDLVDLSCLLPHISQLLIFGNAGSSVEELLVAFLQRRPPQPEVGRDESPPPLDVSPLPMSLVKLSLSRVQVNPASFEHFSQANLTSLDLFDLQSSPAEVHQLLGHLPKLQVELQS